MGGVCIECGNDSGTNAEDCMGCAQFVDGRAAERARIIARIREEAAPGSLHPATSTILLGMADLIESEVTK